MLDLEELFFCFRKMLVGRETFYLDLLLCATGFCCYVMVEALMKIRKSSQIVFVVVIFKD